MSEAVTDEEVGEIILILEARDLELPEFRAMQLKVAALIRKLAAQIMGLQRDTQRWKAVQSDQKLQGSLNGYSTFTQTVDAAIAGKKLDAYMTEYHPGKIANNN